MEAHLLSLNNFNRPAVLDESDAQYMHIIYILLLEPGRLPGHPRCGVGLRSKYRHNNSTNWISALHNDIENQINTYLPELAAVDISLAIQDHVLYIMIDTTTGTYSVAYNDDTGTVEAGVQYVLDDLYV